MRCANWGRALALVALGVGSAARSAFASPRPAQQPLELLEEHTTPSVTREISPSLFTSLERMSRIVDIAYCVGNTGISKPFSCVSRCNEFPTLELVTAWNTGPLLSDSCGYIAVDQGQSEGDRVDSNNWGHGSGAFDVAHGPAIVVAFRGTYSITNTIVDLSTVPQEYVPYPAPDDGPPEHRCDNCTVHMGFLASWTNARTIVLPELKKLHMQYPDYPIQLVGHSLGGAVAALAALELRSSFGWENVRVTTFGEPRVGNKGLCRFIDAIFDLDQPNDPDQWRYRRVTHKGDPVPLLPLGEWGYQSHAGEMFIAKSNLSPSLEDIQPCDGDTDERCIAGEDSNLLEIFPWPIGRSQNGDEGTPVLKRRAGFPTRFKLWRLLSAHRDYFWRLGLCVPGGDPFDWGRDKYGRGEEL
jgi:hypothetical protein